MDESNSEPLCYFLPLVCPQMCWLPTERIGSVTASIRLCQMHPQQRIKCSCLPLANRWLHWNELYSTLYCTDMADHACFSWSAFFISRRLILEVVLHLFIVYKYIYLFIYLFKLICVLFTWFIYWRDIASNLGLNKLTHWLLVLFCFLLFFDISDP